MFAILYYLALSYSSYLYIHSVCLKSIRNGVESMDLKDGCQRTSGVSENPFGSMTECAEKHVLDSLITGACVRCRRDSLKVYWSPRTDVKSLEFPQCIEPN